MQAYTEPTAFDFFALHYFTPAEKQGFFSSYEIKLSNFICHADFTDTPEQEEIPVFLCSLNFGFQRFFCLNIEKI